MRKETALHLSYDTRKLQALQYYLPQNGTSVEAAIVAHLDGIYDTQVPENVKEFLRHMGSRKAGDSAQTADQKTDAGAQSHRAKTGTLTGGKHEHTKLYLYGSWGRPIQDHILSQ